MRSRIETILTGKTGKIYREILGLSTARNEHRVGRLTPSSPLPHEFVKSSYDCYESNYPSNVSINGRIFEFLICEVLLQNGISPIYFQAKFAFIPNIDFDLICYDDKNPVSLSVKTSLRERYKQADLEAMALRQVYRNAECYLLVRTDEYAGVRSKIQNGELFGLTDCMRADSPDFDDLVFSLKRRKFSIAKPITPIQGRPVSTK